MLRLVREQTESDALYFLMGADSLHNFATWRDPATILDLALLAVVQRPGTTLDLTMLAATFPTIQSRVIFVDAPEIALSSTAIRTRVQQGLSIRYEVPPAVSAYIEQQGLYRA
jgi:nicotinate-nucleotide adenylyltransferase